MRAALLVSGLLLLGSTAHAATLTTLFSFDGTNGRGIATYGGLVADASGNIFGTTGETGGSYGLGSVFKYDRAGQMTTFASFDGSNGGHPNAGLTAAGGSGFYGVASNGGTYGYGAVYKIDRFGLITTVASFNGDDGAYSISHL
ncbi:MAG TPA: hypothetical protein PK808_06930, partial [Polymorphobacter sp.]|nr:hypothetical protein [Polymorphobacter sp.]